MKKKTKITGGDAGAAATDESGNGFCGSERAEDANCSGNNDEITEREENAAGEEPVTPETGAGGAPDPAVDAVAELNEKLAAAEKQGRDYLDRWQRSAAEFDNYKRRTQNEMDRLYATSAAEVIAVFLPVIDSIERAVGEIPDARGDVKPGVGAAEQKPDPFREGLVLIERQIKDALRKLDVKELPGAGAQFDPNLHEAVMHVEDAELGSNVIIEVFQKGYIYKERVVRHSVVKVAN